MRAWLKLGYFTSATEDADYWMRRTWISDGPGRRSPRWNSRPRPRKGTTYPPYGPRYEVGDRLVIYLTEPGRCPAILEVTGEPLWDPDRVDRGSSAEGDRWGVVTAVKGIAAVQLAEAPPLERLDVTPASIGQKGHLALDDWQYVEAERQLGTSSPRRRDNKPQSDRVPIEEGQVEEYDVTTRSQIRRAVRRESRLVRDYVATLEAQGDVVFRNRLIPAGSTRAMYTDVFNETRCQLIEAKASTSRGDIRMAIGQLADYSRRVDRERQAGGVARFTSASRFDRPSHQAEDQGNLARGDGFADNARGKFT